VQLEAIATYFLSIAGLAVASWDILRMWSSLDEKSEQKNMPRIDDTLLTCLKNLLKEDNANYNTLLKDYEVCQAEIVRRDNSTLLVGSIFTTASLLILANTISQTFRNSMFVYAFASILLYLLWLLIAYETSKELDEITYMRIHTIEEALSNEKSEYQFGLHSYIWRKTHTEKGKTSGWLKIRRMFWGVVLMLISFAWMLLSLIVLGSLSYILVFGTIVEAIFLYLIFSNLVRFSKAF
jgi:hypothetical protein